LEEAADKVTNEGYKAYWICTGIFTITWGLRPNLLQRIYSYIMTVRLIVTYAATVWWPGIKYKTSRVELTKLQSLECLIESETRSRTLETPLQ
jgi:hypothetical protein